MSSTPLVLFFINGFCCGVLVSTIFSILKAGYLKRERYARRGQVINDQEALKLIAEGWKILIFPNQILNPAFLVPSEFVFECDFDIKGEGKILRRWIITRKALKTIFSNARIEDYRGAFFD